jgi:hypothetical protein
MYIRMWSNGVSPGDGSSVNTAHEGSEGPGAGKTNEGDTSAMIALWGLENEDARHYLV